MVPEIINILRFLPDLVIFLLIKHCDRWSRVSVFIIAIRFGPQFVDQLCPKLPGNSFCSLEKSSARVLSSALTCGYFGETEIANKKGMGTFSYLLVLFFMLMASVVNVCVATWRSFDLTLLFLANMLPVEMPLKYFDSRCQSYTLLLPPLGFGKWCKVSFEPTRSEFVVCFVIRRKVGTNSL